VTALVAVTTWTGLKLAAVVVVALIATGSTVAVAPPAHALPPIPRPPVGRPPIHLPPAPAPEPRAPLDDMLPEPPPSNDPYQYDLPDLDVPPGVVPRSTPPATDDRDSRNDSTGGDASPGEERQYPGGGAGTDTAPTGTPQPPADDEGGSLDLKSLGLIGGGLVSLASFGMWLIRRT
jgi:hypothetical protein